MATIIEQKLFLFELVDVFSVYPTNRFASNKTLGSSQAAAGLGLRKKKISSFVLWNSQGECFIFKGFLDDQDY